MRAKLIFLILGILFFETLSAQTISYPLAYENKIRTYLDSLDSTEFDGSIFITNLLNGNHFDAKEVGIYTFFTLNSHSKSFILFFDGEEIDIQKNYDPDTILTQSIHFINRYQKQLTKFEKATYYEKIIRVNIANLDPPNMLPPPPKDEH